MNDQFNKIAITCFKAYDIRGKVPAQLNDDIAYRVGRAYAEYLGARAIVLGHDVRLTSSSLSESVARGITDAGSDVIFIGQCGTEEVYFATFHLRVDGGICVTASHNPMDYNGMKFVREGARPIASDSGLNDIRLLAEAGQFMSPKKTGQVIRQAIRHDYVEHLLNYIDSSTLQPLKAVVNPGNGGVGELLDELEPHLPFEFVKVHYQADGTFPNGIPNPLLPDRRKSTSDAVIANGADFGLAWDGDFDRCFFFDEKGQFIEGYYVVGLLAQAFLMKKPGAKIVHDPRLIWNTQDLVKKSGGTPALSKTGHAFVKQTMRSEDAIYGGEMSAHHYFKDFAYCDNGTIPWLLVAELLSSHALPLSRLVSDRMAAFPCSGEINRVVNDPQRIIQAVEKHYLPFAEMHEKIDGLSMDFNSWRFNLRMSSTEPLLRLNLESRGDVALMQAKTDELLTLIAGFDSK